MKWFNRNSCNCRRGWPVTLHSDTGIQSNRELAFFLVLILAGSSTVFAKYAGGSGNPGSPYLISSPNDLAQIGHNPSDWSKNFKLTSDINMSAYNAADPNKSFTPIGTFQWDPYSSMPFKGVFDGNNKQIINLNISAAGRDFVGLFGYVQGKNALIRDLTLVNPKIEAGSSMYVGPVVGSLKKGFVVRCKVKGGSITGGDCTGGLVGYNTLGFISNCDSYANVSGNKDVGGIAGYHSGTEISASSFTGEVSGQADVGGLVGESDGNIIDCYSQANVTDGSDEVAGLVGTSRGQITCCYSKSRVAGLNNVGGLVGRNLGVIEDCYARATVTGNYYVGRFGGLLYSEGKISRCYAAGTAESNNGLAGELIGSGDVQMVSASFSTDTDSLNQEMMTQSTYTAAGWDFIGETANGNMDLWRICEATGYPRLFWEKPLAGDLLCPDGVDLPDFAILFDLWLTSPLSIDITKDGIVDAKDFAVLANAWKTKPGMAKWNARCNIWPDGGNHVINIADLTVLAEHWLMPGPGLGDVAPQDTGDGIVNFRDFALAAKNYLNQNY